MKGAPAPTKFRTSPFASQQLPTCAHPLCRVPPSPSSSWATASATTCPAQVRPPSTPLPLCRSAPSAASWIACLCLALCRFAPVPLLRLVCACPSPPKHLRVPAGLSPQPHHTSRLGTPCLCLTAAAAVTLARFTASAEEIGRECRALLRALGVPPTDIRGMGIQASMHLGAD